jgi:ABC-type nickel/cobalt efflux system permease component RcnA
LNPLALLGLGLLLGLRHAVDPDHVVAVTAIAARTRRVLPATLLGIVWGLGHTLTLFAVGAGIILFNWAVPPRLGLAMEFCVALALVVVGLLNLHRPSHGRSELDAGAGRPPARRATGHVRPRNRPFTCSRGPSHVLPAALAATLATARSRVHSPLVRR